MKAFMGVFLVFNSLCYFFFNIIGVSVWVLNSRRIILEPEVKLHQCAAVSLCCSYVKRTDLRGKMLSIFKSIPTHMVILTLLKIVRFFKKQNKTVFVFIHRCNVVSRWRSVWIYVIFSTAASEGFLTIVAAIYAPVKNNIFLSHTLLNV